MSMLMSLKRCADEQIQQLLACPELIEAFTAPADMPALQPARPGFFARLLGVRPQAPAPSAKLPEDWPKAEEADELDLDKAWHGLHYLLTGSDWEGDWPLGFLVAHGTEVGDVDVGYGPARVFTSAQVQEISQALESLTADDLRARYDPARMMELDVYPTVWDSEQDEAREWLVEPLPALSDFVAETARQGKGLVLWLG